MKVHLIFRHPTAPKGAPEIKPREVVELESLPPLLLSYWGIDGEFWKVRDFTLMTRRDSDGELLVSHAVMTLVMTLPRPVKKPPKNHLKLVPDKQGE